MRIAVLVVLAGCGPGFIMEAPPLPQPHAVPATEDAAPSLVTAQPAMALPFPTAQWKRSSKPALSRAPGNAWDSFSAYNPRLARNLDGTAYQDADGSFFLYYTATDLSSEVTGSDLDQTGLALSKDLVNWTRFSSPVLGRGPPGSFDAGDASAVTVIFDGALFHMWFEGNSNLTGPTDRVTINHATSTDGKLWVKDAAPALQQGPGSDAEDLYSPAVLKVGSTWRMWYTGHDAAGRYGLMTASAPSPFGPWTKHGSGYIFLPGEAIFPSDVWEQSGTLYLLYFDSRRLLYATSPDGLAWTPRGEVLAPAAAPAWDSASIYWPSLTRVGATWYLFYNSSAYGAGIGFATASAVRL